MADRGENRNQVSSTTPQLETDELSSSSEFSTTEEDVSPVECADSAVGTSDWFREYYGVRQNGAAFNTRGLPNDDDTDELGMHRPVSSASTQTNPADFIGDSRGYIVSYSRARRSTRRIYDSRGIHIASGLDLCDCYVKECPGCHLSCPKCGSCKCGSTCRKNRKY